MNKQVINGLKEKRTKQKLNEPKQSTRFTMWNVSQKKVINNL